MDKEFLHKINLKALEKETNLSVDEIAELAGIADPKNLGKWAQDKSKGGSRPNYNAIVRLLQKGAETKTLFGVESQSGNNAFVKPPFDDPEFRSGMEQLLLDLKKMGKI